MDAGDTSKGIAVNLSFKDIQYRFARFLLTVAGVGFLVTASIGMVGLYRGIIADALLVIDTIGADLWVVQGDRQGPFSEGSAVSLDLDARVESLGNVYNVRRFRQFSYQFLHNGKQSRAAITTLDYPKDNGSWLNLVYGRSIGAAHFEVVADVSSGLHVGETIHMAKDEYRIVGLTSGMVDASGDAMMFITLNDALAISSQRTSEEILLARSAAQAGNQNAGSSSAGRISAVLVSLDAATDPETVRDAMMSWGDVNVLTQADQSDLLLNQRLWRLRLQILAFTAVLLVVMAIIISLIIYTMTIEKLHQIAMLKLIGARNSLIVSMIAQQAAMIGVGGFAFGLLLSNLIFPYFPRRIVMTPEDLGLLFAAVCIVSAGSSLFGISRALSVKAQEVLS